MLSADRLTTNENSVCRSQHDKTHKTIEESENVFSERIPRAKPYWLTKANLDVKKGRRPLVDVIQAYKAKVIEPGFLKRTIVRKVYEKQNEFVEKSFYEQGPDVYAAAKTVEYQGRFRMVGRDRWIEKLDKPRGTLSLNLNFQLEAVDLSQTNVNIDGIDHFVGCANLKSIYLTRCRYVDDWFCARLAHEFADQLLFLDLSGCPSVGVTGILALSKLRALKKLRLFDLPPFPGKEAASMIFEDELPNCLVEGIEYETPPIAGLLQSGEIDQT